MFDVGDIVRIVKKMDRYVGWTGDMDRIIGKTGVISSIRYRDHSTRGTSPTTIYSVEMANSVDSWSLEEESLELEYDGNRINYKDVQRKQSIILERARY